MLGTSARIGEVLALRKCDVDVTCSPATARLCGTIVLPNGKPTHRQDHPKTSKSTRTVSVPTFTAEVLRQRLVVVAEEDPEHLLFFSRNHTPLTTNNVRRRLRTILKEVGIAGVTPHSFRRTVATVLDRAGGADLAAEMLMLYPIAMSTALVYFAEHYVIDAVAGGLVGCKAWEGRRCAKPSP